MLEQTKLNNLVQIQNNKHYTSRSAVLCYNTCHYKRYLQYELEGTGYTTEAISLDLLIGTVVHRGLQHLLEHCRQEHPDGSFEPACVDQAVEEAYIIWRDILSKHQLALKSSAEYDRLDWIIAEQESLFEGLIRAFAARRLPFLLEEFEVLEVEHEEVYKDFSSVVTFLGKADGLLRRKSDNKLVILSIKTTSEYADVTTRDILHDMQGVSEWVIVQDRLDKAFEFLLKFKNEKGQIQVTDELFRLGISVGVLNYLMKLNIGEKPEIFAIQYEYLIKGQRKQEPAYSGTYKQNSFLCHPMKFDAPMTIFTGVNFGIQVNPDEYKWKPAKGKPPKGWEKVDIWNDIGIKAWIEMLCTGSIQPEEGHPFDVKIDDKGHISGGVLYTPDLVIRHPSEIEEWKVSTRFQEENIVKHLNELKDIADRIIEIEGDVDLINLVEEELELLKIEYKQKIWKYFPKNTLSCHNYYGKDCSYVKHCHEQQSLETLIECGFLIRRESHHELERETLKSLVEQDK